MTTSPVEFIQNQHPFNYLTAADLARIAETLTEKSYPATSRILEQGGQTSQHLFLIREGAVRLVRDGQVIQVLEEGECFGYPSMINQVSPSADVITEEKSVIYLIPREVFNTLLDTPQFSEFFLKNLGERLRRITAKPAPATLGGDFTTAIGQLIVRPPIQVSPAATVAEVAQNMRKAWVDVALIQGSPPGIITDHDFQVKVLAEELGPGTPVQMVMSRPLKTLPSETPVHGALLFMLEENIHHVPVIDPAGSIVGIVSATDLLRHQARSPLYLLRHLEMLDSATDLSQYSLEVAGVVENLFHGGLDVGQIGRIVASINDALLRRLLHLAEKELGPPPTPYAWIVFGSEGRMEQLLLTDQDNALVYQDDTPEAKTYFEHMATWMIDRLMAAGFPQCPGGYMATNWHKPLDAWVKLFEKWMRTPDPHALMETGIFFDFRAVHGELPLDRLEQVVNRAGEHHLFLGHLARATIEFKPPLGFFRRIRAENGQVNLKKGGVAPIVGLARLYALEAKLRTRSTLERLEIAADSGALSADGAENLIETYRFLLQLRLDTQLDAIHRGQKPNNRIDLHALSSRENRNLKDAFLAIREMQEAAAMRFHTDMLG